MCEAQARGMGGGGACENLQNTVPPSTTDSPNPNPTRRNSTHAPHTSVCSVLQTSLLHTFFIVTRNHDPLLSHTCRLMAKQHIPHSTVHTGSPHFIDCQHSLPTPSP